MVDQGDPVDRKDWHETDQYIEFSSGIIGYIRPENDPEHPDHTWHWTLEKGGVILARGWAYNKAQAKAIVEMSAPGYAPDPLELAPETQGQRSAD